MFSGKMRRATIASVLILLLAVFAKLAFSSAEEGMTTIVVPDDFPTIQEAVDAASDGDTVLVNEGTYTLQEPIRIGKRLALIANGSVTIKGEGELVWACIVIEAYETIVKGFTITFTQGPVLREGIDLGGTNCTVFGNTITNCYFGIWAESLDCTISNNFIADNHLSGLYMNGAVDCTISENTFRRNRWGIESEDYRGATSLGNRFYHNNFIDNYDDVAFWHYEERQEVWDNGYPSGGNYWDKHDSQDCLSGPHQNETLSDGVADDPHFLGEVNVDRFPLMKPYPGEPHDVGITYIESRTVVGQDLAEQSVTVALFNYGGLTESLNITAYANGTFLDKVTGFALDAKSSAGVPLFWNITGFPVGRYNLSATALLQDDPDSSDNSHSFWVTITVTGDVNGDFDVDIFDIMWMVSAYNSEKGDPRFRTNFDLDDDGDVDIYDIVIAVGHYGEKCTP